MRNIEIADNYPDAGSFVEWLNKIGYNARVFCSLCSIVDGVSTYQDKDLNTLIDALWSIYDSEKRLEALEKDMLQIKSILGIYYLKDEEDSQSPTPERRGHVP